jgi:hypothetical protein
MLSFFTFDQKDLFFGLEASTSSTGPFGRPLRGKYRERISWWVSKENTRSPSLSVSMYAKRVRVSLKMGPTSKLRTVSLAPSATSTLLVLVVLAVVCGSVFLKLAPNGEGYFDLLEVAMLAGATSRGSSNDSFLRDSGIDK